MKRIPEAIVYMASDHIQIESDELFQKYGYQIDDD